MTLICYGLVVIALDANS